MKLKLALEKGQNIFFTSDPHYDHKNICEGTSNWTRLDRTRLFDTLTEMNANIIGGINDVVGENDILFCLGDWSFNGIENITKFRNEIHCRNIYLILGNHDHHIERNKNGVANNFKGVYQYCELTVVMPAKSKGDKQKHYDFVLFHYPIASWNNMSRGVMHLHGHVHLPYGSAIQEGRAMDVGVDGSIDYSPYSLSEILSHIYDNPVKKLVLPFDHYE